MSKRTLRAYAYRSGQIGFNRMREPMPEGTLYIAHGPEGVVGPLVRGQARLAYDNATYLVPGCPEAETEEQAMQAFMTFFGRIRDALVRRAA